MKPPGMPLVRDIAALMAAYDTATAAEVRDVLEHPKLPAHIWRRCTWRAVIVFSKLRKPPTLTAEQEALLAEYLGHFSTQQRRQLGGGYGRPLADSWPVRLPVEDLESLQRLALVRNVFPQDLFRQAVQEFLKRETQGVHA